MSNRTRTAAAVAWEPAAKISLFELAVSFVDRGCSGVYCSSTGVAAARAAAITAAAPGVGAARGGGGPQEVIRLTRWWSRIV